MGHEKERDKRREEWLKWCIENTGEITKKLIELTGRPKKKPMTSTSIKHFDIHQNPRHQQGITNLEEVNGWVKFYKKYAIFSRYSTYLRNLRKRSIHLIHYYEYMNISQNKS